MVFFKMWKLGKCDWIIENRINVWVEVVSVRYGLGINYVGIYVECGFYLRVLEIMGRCYIRVWYDLLFDYLVFYLIGFFNFIFR